MRLIVLLLLYSFGASASEPLQVVDTINSNPHQASVDPATQSLKYLLDHLPMPYQLMEINRSRARQWTKSAPNACMPWLRRTAQREKDYLFTVPYLVEGALQLVVRTGSPLDQRLPALADAQGRISLTQLMQLQKFPVLGVEHARSYGDRLDALLAGLAREQKLFIRNTPSERVGSMLQMLEKNFIDAALEYPKVMANAGSNTTLRFWPLQEAEPFNLVHFACSKTTAGTRSVAMLNQVIHTAAAVPAYQQMALGSIAPSARTRALQYWQQALAASPP